MDLRLSPRLAHAPSRQLRGSLRPEEKERAPAVADVSCAEAAKEDALTEAVASAEDFATMYDRWTRVTMMNTFVEPGLEASYRAYQLSIYGDRVRKWFLLAAMVATCGTINTELGGYLATGLSGNAMRIRVVMPGSAVLFWAAFFCARSMPKPWLHAFYKRQQVILSSISCAFGFAITLPGILQPDQFDDAPLDDLSSFVQGHWIALVGSTSLITLAWSDLSPVIYTVLSLFFLTLWNVRAITLQKDHFDEVSNTNATTMPSDHEPAVSGVFSVTLLHYLAAWVASVFVSHQKDTLMRRNFVILQIVKVEKDRRIKALRGEKETLEVQLTDLEARSRRQPQHVKFLDNARPRERHTATQSFKHRVHHARSHAAKQGSNTADSRRDSMADGQRSSAAGADAWRRASMAGADGRRASFVNEPPMPPSHAARQSSNTSTRHSMPDAEVPRVRPLATESKV